MAGGGCGDGGPTPEDRENDVTHGAISTALSSRTFVVAAVFLPVFFPPPRCCPTDAHWYIMTCYNNSNAPSCTFHARRRGRTVSRLRGFFTAVPGLTRLKIYHHNAIRCARARAFPPWRRDGTSWRSLRFVSLSSSRNNPDLTRDGGATDDFYIIYFYRIDFVKYPFVETTKCRWRYVLVFCTWIVQRNFLYVLLYNLYELNTNTTYATVKPNEFGSFRLV